MGLPSSIKEENGMIIIKICCMNVKIITNSEITLKQEKIKPKLKKKHWTFKVLESLKTMGVLRIGLYFIFL